MEKRVFENPIIKDKVTIVKTSKETNGAYTLVEVELAVGGGNGLHAHTSFVEEFTSLEGVLGIELGKQQLQLAPGNSAIAQIGQWHRFYNPGDKPVRFLVKLTPGHEGFENGLRIGYGLAENGLTNKKGIPKKLSHLAILLSFTDTRLPGFLSLITPVLLWQARLAVKKGIDKELVQSYC